VTRSPEMHGRDCPVLVPELISIVCQPMLVAAIRCYLIQMLGSALTCTNGCSCWSPEEKNSPRVFLTMDALYRLS
jgi:type IV secretory pathway VirB6-like protein